jgi:glycosyltransferase involved in cell wall biosynthesis
MEKMITIIMTCYNAEDFVGHAISSVLSQTFKEFEFLIYDDASDDNTQKVLCKYMEIDSRIKVFSGEENLGAARGRNYLLNIACGTLIANIDADDEWHAEKLMRQVNAFKENENLVLCTCDVELHQDNQIVNYMYPSADLKLKSNLLTMRRFPAHSSWLYKLEAALKVGCYDALFKRSHDTLLALRLANYGEFMNLNYIGVKYAQRAGNLTNLSTSNGITQLEYGVLARLVKILERNTGILLRQEQIDKFLIHIMQPQNQRIFDRFRHLQNKLHHTSGHRATIVKNIQVILIRLQLELVKRTIRKLPLVLAREL